LSSIQWPGASRARSWMQWRAGFKARSEAPPSSREPGHQSRDTLDAIVRPPTRHLVHADFDESDRDPGRPPPTTVSSSAIGRPGHCPRRVRVTRPLQSPRLPGPASWPGMSGISRPHLAARLLERGHCPGRGRKTANLSADTSPMHLTDVDIADSYRRLDRLPNSATPETSTLVRGLLSCRRLLPNPRHGDTETQNRVFPNSASPGVGPPERHPSADSPRFWCAPCRRPQFGSVAAVREHDTESRTGPTPAGGLRGSGGLRRPSASPLRGPARPHRARQLPQRLLGRLPADARVGDRLPER
jgi:hypothetical protein